jgi:hypothetical protein
MTNWLCLFCMMSIMSNFKIISLENKDEWTFLLGKLPISQQDIYYTPEYYSLYENYGDGKAQCFVFEKNGDIALYPFLINSINEIGYNLDNEYFDIQGAYGYNGVLSNSMDSVFIEKFYGSFNKYCSQNNIVAEFTRFHPLLQNQEFSKNHMSVIFDRETVALDLTQDYDHIWMKEYHSKNRNIIRKAQKDGFRVEIVQDPNSSQIDKFIDTYTYSMKMVDADEYYFFNKEFFYNTFSMLKDNTLLFNIYNKENDLVCSSIFFHYGEFFHYHLSGRTEKANSTVNNFLLDEAVKYAIEIGAKKVHFGGATSSDANDSLLRFKGIFSKTRLPFYIGKKVHNQDIYDKIVKQWCEKHPNSYANNYKRLLGYREI